MTNERKNITQPPDWWAASEKAAQVRGESLSAWVGAACIQCLTKYQRSRLSERPPANRPKKESKE